MFFVETLQNAFNIIKSLPTLFSQAKWIAIHLIKPNHAQLTVSVRAEQAGTEVHGELLPHVVQSLNFSGG